MTKKLKLPEALQGEFAAMRDVIGLVVFAVEARRVLEAIDTVADGIPHIGDTLNKAIDVRRQWTECPDTASAVLDGIYCRLDELLMAGE